MTDETERKLFEKARAGNHFAFDLLQRRLQAPVDRFIRRLIGPRVETDDIRSDAFVALYMNLERLPAAESLRPFLFRVIRNLCYSELRRQGRFASVSLDTAGETDSPLIREIRDPGPSPHDRMQRSWLFDMLGQAIDRLPEIQRQTLILYIEEDLSYQQIAEAMTTDIGTVKSRIFYARQALRKHLPREITEAFDLLKENRRGHSR